MALLDVWRPRFIRPWRELEEMERFFEPTFTSWPFRTMWIRRPSEMVSWAPPLDMYEKEDSFIVRMEIPGLKQEDIDISMTGDTLTIKGERKPPAGVKDEEYQCCEVCYGNFSRSIMMPTSVDANKIEASYEDGILEVHLPKAKEAKPAKIKVKALKAAKA